MEWMSYHAKNYDSNGRVNRNKECKKIISEAIPSESIVKFQMAGSVGYAVLKNYQGRRGAVIVPTSINRSDWNNFKFRIFSENDNPEKAQCPDELLNCLTETEDFCAIEWRKRCRSWNHLKRGAWSINQLPVGTRILANWNGGVVELTKTMAKQMKRPIWYDGYYQYDPIKIQENGYRILNK